MIETPPQASRAAQVTNAPFNPTAKFPSGAEPSLALVALPLLRLVARLGQTDTFDAGGPGFLLIGGRVDAAIATQFPRGMAELLLMDFQTGWQLIGIGRIAFQDPILTDQAPVDFGVPQFVTELGVTGFRFPATNDGGVRFKQTHQFLTGRNSHVFEHTLPRLHDDLLHQRHILLEQCLHAHCRQIRPSGQAGLNPGDLFQQGTHQGDQLRVGLPARFFTSIGGLLTHPPKVLTNLPCEAARLPTGALHRMCADPETTLSLQVSSAVPPRALHGSSDSRPAPHRSTNCYRSDNECYSRSPYYPPAGVDRWSAPPSAPTPPPVPESSAGS